MRSPSDLYEEEGLGVTTVHNFREGIAFIENAYRLDMTGDDFPQP